MEEETKPDAAEMLRAFRMMQDNNINYMKGLIKMGVVDPRCASVVITKFQEARMWAEESVLTHKVHEAMHAVRSGPIVVEATGGTVYTINKN